MRGAKPIWLVGMMGAGKSTIGPALGRRLERPFIDCDEEVERREGCAIAEIFERRGEAEFRRIEAEVIEAAARENAVVALGGGAIAQPGASERLAASGTVVYLRASPERLLERVGDSSDRPLLAGHEGGDRLQRIRSLLESRETCYRSARLTVDTDDASIDEVVAELAARIEEVEGRPG